MKKHFFIYRILVWEAVSDEQKLTKYLLNLKACLLSLVSNPQTDRWILFIVGTIQYISQPEAGWFDLN